MRRRLLVLALALDTLCAVAAPAILPLARGEMPEMPSPYQRIGDVCVEVSDEANAVVAGRPVADSWCAEG